MSSSELPTYLLRCFRIDSLLFLQKKRHVCPPTKWSRTFQLFTHCSNRLKDEAWLGTSLLRSPWEMNRSRSCPGCNTRPLPPQYRTASALFQTDYEPKDKPLRPRSNMNDLHCVEFNLRNMFLRISKKRYNFNNCQATKCCSELSRV
jgi:hypothetical protein